MYVRACKSKFLTKEVRNTSGIYNPHSCNWSQRPKVVYKLPFLLLVSYSSALSKRFSGSWFSTWRDEPHLHFWRVWPFIILPGLG